MGINYITDIVREADEQKRRDNLAKLIDERMPSELLALAAISVLSNDPQIRRTALERVDARDREEGNAAARVISLLQSWRREGKLMTYSKPMDNTQLSRSAQIEGAFHARASLSSAVGD